MSNEKIETTGSEHNAQSSEREEKSIMSMKLTSDLTVTNDKGEEQSLKNMHVSLHLKASDALFIVEGVVKHLNQTNNQLQQQIRTLKDKENQKTSDNIKHRIYEINSLLDSNHERDIPVDAQYYTNLKNELTDILNDTQRIHEENQKKVDELLQTIHTTNYGKVFAVKNMRFTSNNVGEILVRFEHAGDANAAKEYVQRSLDYIKKQMEDTFKSRD